MVPFSYSLRNIRVRLHTTLAASLGVSLVVFVLAGSAMLNAGLKRMLTVGERPEDAIVLAVGAGSEIESNFPVQKANIVSTLPQVAADGGPLASFELLITLSLPSAKTGTVMNALVRGVSENTRKFHPEFKIIQGREPSGAADELIVGRNVAGRFLNTNIGDTLVLGKQRKFTVVGVFSDAGGSAESELWAGLQSVQSVFSRDGAVSNVNVRLRSASDFAIFRDVVEHDRRLGLKAMTRQAFAEKQSEMLSLIIGVLGSVISIFFGLSAVLGASVAIYGSVASRTREFGTLRALGFTKGQILTSVLFESIVLTLMGGTVGAVLALVLGGGEFTLPGPNWGQVVFRFEPTPAIISRAMVASLIAGALGGLIPALRASRIPPTAALRAQ